MITLRKVPGFKRMDLANQEQSEDTMGKHHMKALVLEKIKKLCLRDIDIKEDFSSDDVRIAIHTVGICGSDIHYYLHGKVGHFILRKPMVLGHEASGTVVEVGSRVRHLRVGDRVCMEPGIPLPGSKTSRLGMYNLDPSIRF